MKAGVSFGRNKFELGSVAPQEEKVESFFVGGDSTCRVVATLAMAWLYRIAMDIIVTAWIAASYV